VHAALGCMRCAHQFMRPVKKVLKPNPDRRMRNSTTKKQVNLWNDQRKGNGVELRCCLALESCCRCRF